MPWKVPVAVSIQRSAFLADVSSGLSISAACAAHGISRVTGHKWLKRFRANPMAPLCDHSRKPKHSPLRCDSLVEDAVLRLRDRFGWGPQKIHGYYLHHPLPLSLPSERTIANILLRHNRIASPPPPPPDPISFERSYPNQLWQFDFKGALEINRQRVLPLCRPRRSLPLSPRTQTLPRQIHSFRLGCPLGTLRPLRPSRCRAQ